MQVQHIPTAVHAYVYPGGEHLHLSDAKTTMHWCRHMRIVHNSYSQSGSGKTE